MQDYRLIEITRDEVVPTAERMRKEGRALLMIHAYIQKDGQMHISWDYPVDDYVESYYVVGETKVPSIVDIYDAAAQYPELELYELLGIEFEGLDTSKRLFLPEDMLEDQGKGQIMVTPLSELVENMARTKEEE